jgi:hypothetical protein
MLSVDRLSVIMRNVVMLSVVAPPDYLRLLSASVIKLFFLFLPIKLDRLSSLIMLIIV